METKLCRKCGQEKPTTEFHKDKATRDGLRTKCKSCVKIYDDSIKEKRDARGKEIYRADPALKIQKTRKYHLDNPEWSKKTLREWHQKNKVRRSEKVIERFNNDPEFRAYRKKTSAEGNRKRRALLANCYVEYNIDYGNLLASYKNSCYICNVKLVPEILHWDHFMPLSKGGAHSSENLRPTCFKCNVRKNNLWPITEEIMTEIRTEVRQIWINLGLIESGGEL